ncbi:nucleoside:proton symporter [Kovacikia minuta CCNUW1]|uniref:NupC/NupG family nucleoside CNT transporter n=1 Tax=Kovacikia minuta TaxID=2931930 RepID=UPI001CCDDB75|nr:nucleoside transporter C-terminal domain-containing protein [Kovacikia minuta]UBF23950.1 nucleoside:proton symporter [Kovacikia minuta CCNUW1]
MPWLNLLSLVGIIGFCAIAWLSSENRQAISWRVIFWGIGLQLVLALLVFLVPFTRSVVVLVNDAVNSVLDVVEAGSRFVFGSVLVPDSANVPGPVLAGRWIARAITPPYVPVPGDRLNPDNINMGYIFAFRALPTIIFFSALMSLGYTLRLVQPIVNWFAHIFRRSMNLSGAEALSGAANIFLGIEATLVVRPYLVNMTRSELCAVLTCCFGSLASNVLGLYAQFMRPVFPNITGHLISASIMSIPACFVMSKLLVPEVEVPKTLGQVLEETPDAPVEEAETSNGTVTDLTRISPMESLVIGAMDGVRLAIAIAALLIAVLGLVAIINLFFNNLASLASSQNPVLQGIGRIFQVVTLQNILAALYLPLTFLTGVSLNPQELWQASSVIGRRLLETEVSSFAQLASLTSQGAIGDRAVVVVSYALSGFALIPSVGIFVGGLIGLIPSRRKDITELGWKALWAATLATMMLGAVAGVFDFGSAAILGR